MKASMGGLDSTPVRGALYEPVESFTLLRIGAIANTIPEPRLSRCRCFALFTMRRRVLSTFSRPCENSALGRASTITYEKPSKALVDEADIYKGWNAAQVSRRNFVSLLDLVTN
jgi:hypothetical protein